MNNQVKIVASFYKFSKWENFHEYKNKLYNIADSEGVVGTILIAAEGINGSISGYTESVNKVIKFIRSIEQFNDIKPKISLAHGRTFRKMKVRIKKEIVSMGLENIEPENITGELIDPDEWDRLVSRDDILIIDTRNIYEHSIGAFKGATLAKTSSFREFPEWADNNLPKEKNKQIAMYCTGGIRCEKASSYLINKGYKNVYQLSGGILKYLEERKETKSNWKGECFVFDYRVSLEHELKKGNYDMCHACRMPISEKDKSSRLFNEGISCPKCHQTHSEKSIKRFEERKLQLNLEKKRKNA